jgi:two-component system chemotaxis sensor kinase CheA
MSEENELDEIVREFLVESHENLDRLDRDLLRLERAPQDAEAIKSIFRTIHTIKGTCGFLGFSTLEGVAHAGESLLARLRDGELSLTPPMMQAMLDMVDVVRTMLAQIEKTGKDAEGDYSQLIDTLTKLQAGEEPEAPPAPEEDLGDAESPPPPAEAGVFFGPPPTAARTGNASSSKPSVEAATSSPAASAAKAPAPAPALPARNDEHEDHTVASYANMIASAVLAAASSGQEKGPSDKSSEKADKGAETGEARSVSDAYVRVDVGLLDKLMNLVGELVLARNQILQFVPEVDEQNFSATCQRLNLITTELQSGVMKTRMQPIGNIWDKFPRVVRDLSHACGKQVLVEMEGKETELDKTIIEAIKDPLTHLVRNCVDHGIEAPEDRATVGKPPQGRLTLRAFHEGGQVNIEISDDGAGIDVDRIRNKAIERGLITPESAARMSERDLQNLIFLPGFSTAKRVSNISGRGVGMDVVKTNIEKIGGLVDLSSRLGEGSSFRIKIPLTLAIIPALMVSSSGDRYAIPQVSLLELLRVGTGEIRSRIENVHGTPVYRLRGDLLPLVFLNSALNFDAEGSADAAAGTSAPETINIVVLQAEDRRFGLVVDQINDTEEIVVKPLGRQLKGISVFAGATILGDGRVALILDVLGLAQLAGVVGAARDRTAAIPAPPVAAEATAPLRTLLLFATAEGRRMALPLSMVTRLENFAPDDVERAGDRHVVQYRSAILPLVDVGTAIGGSPTLGGETPFLSVVVYSEGKRSAGLVVGEILDIVESRLDVTLMDVEGTNPVLGCAVIEGKVTDLVDVRAVLSRSGETWATQSAWDVIEAPVGDDAGTASEAQGLT